MGECLLKRLKKVDIWTTKTGTITCITSSKYTKGSTISLGSYTFDPSQIKPRKIKVTCQVSNRYGDGKSIKITPVVDGTSLSTYTNSNTWPGTFSNTWDVSGDVTTLSCKLYCNYASDDISSLKTTVTCTEWLEISGHWWKKLIKISNLKEDQ